MSDTIQCPTCSTVSQNMIMPTKGDLGRFAELFDSPGWRVYKEVVRQEVMRATDRLLCEEDPAKLPALRATARALVHFSQWEDRMRALMEKEIITDDQLAAILMDIAQGEER